MYLGSKKINKVWYNNDMINELVKQINESLENDCYMTALTTALILPDVCGKAEYPEIKTSKERYIKWYDKYVSKQDKLKVLNNIKNDLTGDIIYDLRCSLLHEANPNVSKRVEDIVYFELIWQGYNRCSYMMEQVLSQVDKNGNHIKKEYLINILYICKMICDAAKSYYNYNKELFNFFNYEIHNTNKNTRKLFGIKKSQII